MAHIAIEVWGWYGSPRFQWPCLVSYVSSPPRAIIAFLETLDKLSGQLEQGRLLTNNLLRKIIECLLESKNFQEPVE